jgi:hypothetical protein
LALCSIGSAATAGERYGQWSLESQGEGIIALSVYCDARINWTTRVLLQSRQQVRRGLVAPSPGTFKNQQAPIPVAIQESGDGYGSFDLPQRWENEGEYIFLEMPDEQGQLASYLKDREVEMH